jgi:aminoglycoside phosphotransferase (APT) family kinase protein
MIPGAPLQARWIRAEPRKFLPTPSLDRLLHGAFGPCRVLSVHPLSGGFRNANFKIQLDGRPSPLVLRIYEHDPSLCQKEIDLLRLVAASVPVPQVLHAESREHHGLPPFAVMQFIEGITFHDLVRTRDPNAIAQAASSAGETLAAIGRFTFPNSGWLAPGPTVTAPLLEGPDPCPRFVDLCLDSPNLQARLPTNVRDRVHTLVWSQAVQFAALDTQRSLVHADFGKRNLLVRCEQGRWSVVSVLDWEFAVAASPLIDLGHLLRYERASQPCLEPHFSAGYVRAGGTLPQDWRRLGRLLDLTALVESLTHEVLPDDVVAELRELVRATTEDREAHFA